MPKITLENGRVVEISKESYDELSKAVKKWDPMKEHKYWVTGPALFSDDEKRLKKMRKKAATFARLLMYVEEFDRGWEEEWDDPIKKKYFVHYGFSAEWTYSYKTVVDHLGVYMSEECAKDLVKKLNSGEVEL